MSMEQFIYALIVVMYMTICVGLLYVVIALPLFIVTWVVKKVLNHGNHNSRRKTEQREVPRREDNLRGEGEGERTYTYEQYLP